MELICRPFFFFLQNRKPVFMSIKHSSSSKNGRERAVPEDIPMAYTTFPSHHWHETKYRKTAGLIIIIFVLIATMSVSVAQFPNTNCNLEFQTTLFGNAQNCDGGDWGGFLLSNCCGVPFKTYLYALGQRANRTGEIYLNSTDQRNCLTSLKSVRKDILSCGIERLSSGGGGCSDFSLADVEKKLGEEMRSLEENCKLLGSNDEWDQTCGTCWKSWNKIVGLSPNRDEESVKAENEICRFAALVSLANNRIDDTNWIQAVYRCLEEPGSSTIEDKQASDSVKRTQSSGKNKINKALLIVFVSLLGILVVVIIAAYILWRRLINVNSSTAKDVKTKEFLPKDQSSQNITIKEIYSATNDLSALNFIGQGTAGKVYKGVLSNGRHVAVKHIINEVYVDTFVREVTSLSHVRHPNLVPLLGYCEEQKECFLVYDLCPNGNLSEWLFGKDKVLSWIQRLEIAIDSSRGLWFLHTYPEGSIVHRDIKPTNILLGSNFKAKLSDFGLSKVIEVGQSYVSSEVRGTFGYVDPEYHTNHHVNSSGDVYSFGIVLLQILSGKRVINLNLKRPMPLNKMAKVLTRGGNITEFADPKLNGEYSTEAFSLVLELALSCTTRKQQRPSMEQVARRLETALDISSREKSLSLSPSTQPAASEIHKKQHPYYLH